MAGGEREERTSLATTTHPQPVVPLCRHASLGGPSSPAAAASALPPSMTDSPAACLSGLNNTLSTLHWRLEAELGREHHHEKLHDRPRCALPNSVPSGVLDDEFRAITAHLLYRRP